LQEKIRTSAFEDLSSFVRKMSTASGDPDVFYELSKATLYIIFKIVKIEDFVDVKRSINTSCTSRIL